MLELGSLWLVGLERYPVEVVTQGEAVRIPVKPRGGKKGVWS